MKGSETGFGTFLTLEVKILIPLLSLEQSLEKQCLRFFGDSRFKAQGEHPNRINAKFKSTAKKAKK